MTSTADLFRTELKRRLQAKAQSPILRVATSPEVIVELTGEQIVEQGLQLARRHAADARRGSVVLLLLPHSVELFLLHIGLVLTGRIPAILAWPTNRVDAEKYQRNLLHQLRNLPAELVITVPNLASNLRDHLTYPVAGCICKGSSRWEEVFASKTTFADLPPLLPTTVPFNNPGNALFLQFSGGTTGAQKAVVITSDILANQLDVLRDALAFTKEDSVVSWLPMYHDMGLIGCLWLPLWNGAPSLQFAASDWLLNPALLFDFIEQYGGTFTWLPNFAFSYLAGQSDRMSHKRSLASMRGWVNCSEPVRQRSFHAFAQQFQDWGVKPEVLQASYAMAENVFAVTQTKLGERAPTFRRTGITNRQTPQLSFDLLDDVYVSSGKPVEGMQIRIIDPQTMTQCQDGEAGEIQLKTVSMFRGYWGSEGFVTSSFTSDGWYATGDFGFLAENELYVVGRLKDIIIVAGQNIFPEDVELTVNTVPEVYSGRVVAFGIPNEQQGTESLVVVAEMRGNYAPEIARELEKQIHSIVLTNIGIAPRRVMVVPERWIVKSTAGKISRKETRERYLKETAAKIMEAAR